MLFYHEYVVRKHERGLLFKKGDFVRFLAPGTYRLFGTRTRYNVERFDLSQPRFEHRLADFFVKHYAADVQRLVDVVETGSREVAVIYHNRRFAGVIGPEQRVLYWKGVVDVSNEKFDISEGFVVAPRIARMLVGTANRARTVLADDPIYLREVPEGHIGLLYVDGKLERSLESGLHAFWKYNRGINVSLVDLRVLTQDVSGQEILTRDKVTLRINLTANYRYTDVMKAMQAVKDPTDLLYREIQFALRAVIGTRTLDTLLEDKSAVDRVVFETVHDKFAEIGVDVRSIGVKDIILPGDMKIILGKVVEAEKAAQANVIRRREETNATRSLLNTAKVMEDNPTALRLKELETLEKVTDKIGTISVYGGLDSVLDGLVQIKR
jgi:regulator of protease activity HflC (stomatin/prohibitin superfamily)